MAFPSQSGRPALADTLREIQNVAGTIKARAQSVSAQGAAGNISAAMIVDLQAGLKKRLDRLNVLKGTSGLTAYAQAQFDDGAFDIAAEFTAMLTEVQLVLDQIKADLPTSAGGFIEERKIEADDTITGKTFTPGQTAGLRTRLDALVATID
jgi:uncharacterized phage infection (PIP) family protein YhgE